MGRLSLRRLLTIGLSSILFLSFSLTAAGVALMVRQDLWRTGVVELELIVRPVERFTENQEKQDHDPAELARRQRRAERLQNSAGRGLRRLSRGRGEVFLLRDGVIVHGAEDGESSWGDEFSGLRDGVQLLEHEGTRWQVLSKPLKTDLYDQVVAVRPWSPFLRIVKALVAYQVLTMTLVLGLAVLAVRALARRISTPLEELRAWSERVGQAKSEPLLRGSKIAEVSALQDSFSEMGERVESALATQRRFVADASHELKTPLTAISGMLELLESRPEMTPEDRLQAIVVAKSEATRMGTLVSDLLVLSRAEAKRSGQREAHELAPMVEQQLATLRLLFPAQIFTTELDSQASWFVNPDAFARIVRNLVENAANHASGQPILVTLRTEGGEVSLSVADQGGGIPAERLESLFQRFYRVDDGRSRDRGGFGLGLAIVKALVEEVGGELSCQSVVGQGSTFRVLFKKS